jgi:hypothetical protein
MSTEAIAAPEAPANPLCSSEHPSDVISAAQNVLRFLHDAKGDENDEQDQSFREGREWIWAMAHDALSYAQELTDQSAKAVSP